VLALATAVMGQAGIVTSEPVRGDRSVSAPTAEPAGGPADDVKSAAAALATLPGRPLAEHAEVYEELHGRLQAALRSIDD
jgi:hypothetical protein